MTDELAKGRVVVGVDGSEDGNRAVEYGVRAALSKGADLLLAHAVDDAVLAGAWGVVYDPGLLQDAGHEAAEGARRHAVEMGMPEDRVQADIFMGNPAAVLTRLSEDAPLVVVGRRAMSGLERLFVGSTSVGVAASASCPVIMVSAASHKPKTGDLGVIGVGLDGTERCSDALRFAFVEASHRGARLQVIHAFELPTGFFADRQDVDARRESALQNAQQGIGQLVEPLRAEFPDVVAEIEIVNAHPVNELTRRSGDLDLLILGVHGFAFPGLSPGATIRAIMAHGLCPLGLVRNKKKQ
ncbi:nucleotide-binding universal stress UspA family protein [Propionibacteriaceae bacterium ES.041]|uniref:Universal stress protein UspA n=1 Tax=Enemella evansiae TaxID=2016499 RepID=A0A255G1Q8_9ACTN|nr:universal stress protein [Enemella evansiae]PFG66949.1 nucleotide-binding universal stress UspA family protein [Propionibacteriaceae bacterium ES.041]OYO02242.1 universal stress protein UspA [Enemella evansiae]OYO09511.1 universal stress protein UspA [Enemella evansiae]OYO15252.1 universal stress protein UspA [Enemella evansiae]OYO20321.1 universal stress protein UspA [Enemella evansiae]